MSLSERIIVIRNVKDTVSQEQVRYFFSACGDVERVISPSEGIYYLLYKHSDSVSRAIQSLDGQVFHGRKLIVNPLGKGREGTVRAIFNSVNEEVDQGLGAVGGVGPSTKTPVHTPTHTQTSLFTTPSNKTPHFSLTTPNLPIGTSTHTPINNQTLTLPSFTLPPTSTNIPPTSTQTILISNPTFTPRPTHPTTIQPTPTHHVSYPNLLPTPIQHTVTTVAYMPSQVNSITSAYKPHIGGTKTSTYIPSYLGVSNAVSSMQPGLPTYMSAAFTTDTIMQGVMDPIFSTTTNVGSFGQQQQPYTTTNVGGFGQQQQQPYTTTNVGGFGQQQQPYSTTVTGGPTWPHSRPQLSTFSGLSSATEVSYKQWQYEVQGLRREGYLEYQLVNCLRRSLRGRAAEALLNLGPDVGIDQILDKFQRLFGEIQKPEILLQDFFNARQRSSEDVTTWGCRLESVLAEIPEVHRSPEMIKSKFWSGLNDERVKCALRHRYESNVTYESLLVYARMVEAEYKKGSGAAKADVKGATTKREDELLIEVKKLASQLSRLSLKVDNLEKKGKGGQQGNRQKQSEKAKDKKKEDETRPEQTDGKETKRGGPICYKCRERGHIRKDCPN